MAIGDVIKKLRRERDITQEQLADMLGITSRAVSQWECGRASPDISQLPILSNIFGVSADILLEIDITQKEKRIDEILKEAESHWSKGYNNEGAKILREGLKEFPNSYKIMFNLMSCMWRVRDEPENADKYDEMTAEVISLGEKILAECTDTDLRYSALQLLCYTYPDVGEEEKALQLANKLPSYINKEIMLISIYRGTKKFNLKREMFLMLINDLYIECLKKASEHLIINDTTYDPDSEYTCLLLRGREIGGISHNIDCNDTMYQLNEMDDAVFDPIRESDEFIAIENELKKYAKKH